jgi:hypothetical protein
MSEIVELQVERDALIAERHEADAEIKRLAHRARVMLDVEAKLDLAELREISIRLDQKQREIEAAIERLNWKGAA